MVDSCYGWLLVRFSANWFSEQVLGVAGLFLGRHSPQTAPSIISKRVIMSQSGQQEQVVAEDCTAHGGGVILKSLKQALSKLERPF